MVTLTHDSRDTKWAGTVQFEKFEFKKKKPGIVFVCLKEQKKNRIGSWTQKKKI